MKRSLALSLLILGLLLPAAAQTGGPEASDLESLLRPIAIYPDPLLAQILPAATQPEELQAAAQWLKDHPGGDVSEAGFSPAVAAVAHYPELLELLNNDPEYTQALGDAFTNQSSEVIATVQGLRKQAYDFGNLVTTPEQTVAYDDESQFVSIVPTNPGLVYLPTYNPALVYCPRPVNYGYGSLISFRAGSACGPWLTFGLDWLGRSCYSFPRGGYWGSSRVGYSNYCNPRYVHNYFVGNNCSSWSRSVPVVVNRPVSNFNTFNTYTQRPNRNPGQFSQTGYRNSSRPQWNTGFSNNSNCQPQWNTGFRSNGSRSQWNTGFNNSNGSRSQWNTGFNNSNGYRSQWNTGFNNSNSDCQPRWNGGTNNSNGSRSQWNTGFNNSNSDCQPRWNGATNNSNGSRPQWNSGDSRGRWNNNPVMSTRTPSWNTNSGVNFNRPTSSYSPGYQSQPNFPSRTPSFTSSQPQYSRPSYSNNSGFQNRSSYRPSFSQPSRPSYSAPSFSRPSFQSNSNFRCAPSGGNFSRGGRGRR